MIFHPLLPPLAPPYKGGESKATPPLCKGRQGGVDRNLLPGERIPGPSLEGAGFDPFYDGQDH